MKLNDRNELLDLLTHLFSQATTLSRLQIDAAIALAGMKLNPTDVSDVLFALSFSTTKYLQSQISYQVENYQVVRREQMVIPFTLLNLRTAVQDANLLIRVSTDVQVDPAIIKRELIKAGYGNDDMDVVFHQKARKKPFYVYQAIVITPSQLNTVWGAPNIDTKPGPPKLKPV